MAMMAVVMFLLPAVEAGRAHAGSQEGEIFYAKKCASCHSIGEEKGKMAHSGGPIDGVGEQRSAEWLREYFLEPKSRIDGAKMPKIKMTDQELDDVISYMMTIK